MYTPKSKNPNITPQMLQNALYMVSLKEGLAHTQEFITKNMVFV